MSELSPIDPAAVPDLEKEHEAPWIVRKLVGSMTGRIVMSSYETLRATGAFVICLSPWGDSSPLQLPCIRFRDLAFHFVVAATGGSAAIAAPVLGPASDILVSSLGDSIIVEIGVHTGFELGYKAADDLVTDQAGDKFLPSKDRRVNTTAIKTVTITLKHKLTVKDAALGFYRSSVHKDSSLFSNIKDYLSIEKGWFSPYIFASNRRPIIPRSLQPDVVFCHGPFLSGDYRVGQTLLDESATVIMLCNAPGSSTTTSPQASRTNSSISSAIGPNEKKPEHTSVRSIIASAKKRLESHSQSSQGSQQSEDSLMTSPASPTSTAVTSPTESIPTPKTFDPVPSIAAPERRLFITVVGIKPHRTSSAWSTSHRPESSVIRYLLLNGVPSLVVPAKTGCPLVAWDTLTLESLYKIEKTKGADGVLGVVDVLLEYLCFCVEWERITLPLGFTPPEGDVSEEDIKKAALKDALGVLIAGAVNSKESKAVKKDVDLDRAGIVMFRIP